MKILIFFSVLSLFVGCSSRTYKVTQEQEQVYFDEYVKRSKACLYNSSWVEAETCAVGVRRQFFNQIGYKYMDLAELFNAYALAMAGKKDRGEISNEDGGLLLVQRALELDGVAVKRLSAQPNGWLLVLQFLAAATSSYLEERAGQPTLFYKTDTGQTYQQFGSNQYIDAQGNTLKRWGNDQYIDNNGNTYMPFGNGYIDSHGNTINPIY